MDWAILIFEILLTVAVFLIGLFVKNYLPSYMDEKREAEAEVVREGNKLVIRSFYPMNLMQKLSLQKEYVEDWKQLVESIMIDWNYDGVVMQPMVTDVPDKKEFVAGIYDIPEDAGTIKVKITDLLSESLEVEV